MLPHSVESAAGKHADEKLPKDLRRLVFFEKNRRRKCRSSGTQTAPPEWLEQAEAGIFLFGAQPPDGGYWHLRAPAVA
jgi:hypothetical protein